MVRLLYRLSDTLSNNKQQHFIFRFPLFVNNSCLLTVTSSIHSRHNVTSQISAYTIGQKAHSRCTKVPFDNIPRYKFAKSVLNRDKNEHHEEHFENCSVGPFFNTASSHLQY